MLKKKPTFVDTVKSVLWAVAFAVVIRSLVFEPFHIPSDSMLPNLFVGDNLFVGKLSYGYSRQSFPFSPNIIKDRIFKTAPKQGDVVVFKKIKGHPENYIKRLVGMPNDTVQVKRGILHLNGKPVERKPAGEFYIINIPMQYRNLDNFSLQVNPTNQTATIIGGKKLFINGRPIDKKDFTIAYKYDEFFGGTAREMHRYVETLPNGLSHYLIEISDNHIDAEGFSNDNTPIYKVPENHYFMMGDNRDLSQDSRYLNEVGYIHSRDLIGRANIIFFSHNNSVRFWELWKLLKPIRWERFLNIINARITNDEN